MSKRIVQDQVKLSWIELIQGEDAIGTLRYELNRLRRNVRDAGDGLARNYTVTLTVEGVIDDD